MISKGHWDRVQLSSPASAARPGKELVDCGGHELSERAAHPCAGLAGCGSGFSGSRTTPFASPPLRGAGAAASGL